MGLRWWWVLLAAGCERTVASDADCEAWVDPCGGCAQRCTPTWEVPGEGEPTCDIDCPTDPLPACVADGGTCAFED